jgi:predicted nuclease of predicted toxin-antitoxin system
MKFLADMCISPQTVKWLRTLGYDAVHLSEEELQTLPDCDVMQKAKTEKRILLTMDLDFTRLAASVGINGLPLVVVFRLNDQRPLNVQSRLSAIMATLKNMNGSAVVSVSENKVRIRKLPIKKFL